MNFIELKVKKIDYHNIYLLRANNENKQKLKKIKQKNIKKSMKKLKEQSQNMKLFVIMQ